MSSSRRPDRRHELPADWAPPTTAADVAALREARRLSLAAPDRFSVLALADLFLQPPRRSTAAGRTPFRLPSGK
jgi:hypothetical protein